MDKRKIEAIYEENVRSVYKYLFCLTHNADLTEELTQETFYQATKGIDSFRGDCKISVWLCQIAKRLWYKELERRRYPEVSLEEETGEELPVFCAAEDEYLLKVEKVELFRLLHGLEGAAKEVIYLRLAGDLSFAEIGSIMGKSETWARVIFYRGKQKLLKGRREEWNKN